ncbi:hypothetical protein CALCODRAFT_417182, partial [Calocera cornea HHB12733]
RWTAAEEEELVDMLTVELANGNQAESGWKRVVWGPCVDALHAHHPQPAGLKKERSHVKTHWQTATQTMTANDEVWDAYLAAHDEMHQFQNHPFPLYDRLTPLVEPVTATGNHAIHLASGASPSPSNYPVQGERDGEVSKAEEHEE